MCFFVKLLDTPSQSALQWIPSCSEALLFLMHLSKINAMSSCRKFLQEQAPEAKVAELLAQYNGLSSSISQPTLPAPPPPPLPSFYILDRPTPGRPTPGFLSWNSFLPPRHGPSECPSGRRPRGPGRTGRSQGAKCFRNGHVQSDCTKFQQVQALEAEVAGLIASVGQPTLARCGHIQSDY
ncbi:hypothetical protein FLAG1_04486 [Fusarium langsethiae]|uniref:Uncharacterized protein n=1 Tax=Fusarium langsethiae TaxID=179993 RepID=A0A0N0DFJ4_FUSLA|nr:hypothetical protein FLAG1_04486 [Fusarium langsethiae]GKU04325.1 unnamed protein product [Fusarium langsethiae]GKU17842.1 unnamed protein product [Fusarium langsethiae]